MIGWDDHDYLGVYKEPTRGATEYKIGASEQADGSWTFTLFCPFDTPRIATTKHAKDIPSKRLGIECSACGRFFRFRFPIHLVARQAVGTLNLRDFPLALRNDFKAWCAKEGFSMSQVFEAFMRAALSGAFDPHSLLEGKVVAVAREGARTAQEAALEVFKGKDDTSLIAPIGIPPEKHKKGGK
jgi:hypothetical protein